MIHRLITRTNTLTKTLRFNYLEEWGQHFIRPLHIPIPQQFKKQKIFRKNKQLNPYPKVKGSSQDPLFMPGLNEQILFDLQKQLLIKGQIGISNQHVAFLLYHLAKDKLMLPQTMDILEEWIPRHKGEYTSRQIFGCLYGMIILNRPKYIQFFLDEVLASNLKFQLSEALEIVQALNKNKGMTLEQKHKFWEDNFKTAFTENMHRLLSFRISTTFRIFDAFHKFEYYDEQIWDRIITMMDGKTGWARTAIIERLYPLTGTFQKAKIVFDKYYTKLSTNRNIIWRYNLEQLRLYSSEEMIAKSQENINMVPNFRTMLPKEKLAQIIQKYETWQVSGAVKKDQEIIRDKSASFGYAIKDRFESLAKDKADFSKMTKQEFEQLFGEYDEELMKDKDQQPAAEGENAEAEGQEQQQQ